jgi:hypothetical protein
MLRILYHGTKIEANTWNSVPNHSAEEETAQTSAPWNKNRNKLSEFRSEAVSEENILFAGAGFFVKLIFFPAISFHSEPRNGLFRKLGMPRTERFFPRNNGNHSESIPRNFFVTKFRCQPYFSPVVFCH